MYERLSARLGAFAFAASLLILGTTLPVAGADSGALALGISPKRALVSLAFVGALVRRSRTSGAVHAATDAVADSNRAD